MLHNHIFATVLVTGNSTDSLQTFTAEVNTKVYDVRTGNLYVGLNDSNDTYNIAKAERPIGAEKPKFTAIAPTAGIFESTAVSALALSYQPKNQTYPFIGIAFDANQKARAINQDGSKYGVSENLLDAAGNTTNEVKATLAASESYLYYAVAPQGGTFGDEYSGIAVVCLKEEDESLSLTQTAAQSGDPFVKAQKVDANTNQVKINNPPTVHDSATLYWDVDLNRLYIGLETTIADADNGAKCVVVGRCDCGVLTLSNIIANNDPIANNPKLNEEPPNIVAAKNDVAISIADEQTFQVNHIRVMHCSTGPSYLIVDAYNSVAPLHTIYALPLIDNPSNADQHGTVANPAAALVNNVFVTAPTAAAELPRYDQLPVMVGAGDLPIGGGSPDPTLISDMQVIGDTVYVSIATAQDTENDNGIFYSQAIFDDTGKIARWTPWTKRAFPFYGFCDSSCTNLGVKFFAVDAVNGKVWAVDGLTKQVVKLTAWDRGNDYSTLPSAVSAKLSDGCFSVLDLDQGTRGFLLTPHRYTVFGGCNQVVFARVSEAMYPIKINSPQTVINDFSDERNLYVSDLPQDSGCVTCLEYARRTSNEGSTNYFFAGTPHGLYVLSSNGFPVGNLGYVNAPPFTGAWQYITTLKDPIIDIKTTGKALYVIMQSIKDGKLGCTLYKYSITADVETMFAASNQKILAQSYVGEFANIVLFTSIQPIITDAENDKEQLLLGTNYGVFCSAADQITDDGISDADDQTEANWQAINNNTLFTYAIAGMDTPQPGTSWPISVTDLNCKSYTRSCMYQCSSGSLVDSCALSLFNAETQNDAGSPFKTLLPITYAWTDSARRFFIINKPNEPATTNKLMVFPYQTSAWGVANPLQHILRYDSVIRGTERYFWVKQIGITGILMVGTERGVIALE